MLIQKWLSLALLIAGTVSLQAALPVTRFLQAGAKIIGRVLDGEGQPIPGAMVHPLLVTYREGVVSLDESQTERPTIEESFENGA